MENENDVNEVKPVKLGIGATVALVICLVVMVFIVVITIRGCSIQKVEKSVPTEQYSEVVPTEVPETTSNIGTTTTEVVETQPETTVAVTAPTEVSIIEKDPNPTKEQFTSSSSDGIVEVADPVLSEDISSYGMVIGKHVYKRSNSYVYGVSISVIRGDKSVIAEYFCPRNTYNSLKSGDSLNVIYQEDSNGGISISTISFS